MRRREYYAMYLNTETPKLPIESDFYAVNWQPLENDGTSNLHFIGMFNDRHLVLRVNACASVSFGASPLIEAEVLSRIGGKPWAPEILANEPNQGWCLMAHYPGHAKNLNAQQVLDVAIQFQDINDVPLFDYQKMINHYSEQLPDSRENRSDITLLQTLLTRLPDQTFCLVHQDLHAGNILSDGDQMIIIDWEYSGLGCPWLDIAFVRDNWTFEIELLKKFPVVKPYSMSQVSEILQTAHQFNQLLSELWFRVRKSHLSDNNG